MQVNQSGSLQMQENKKEQEIVSRYSSIKKSLIMTPAQEYIYFPKFDKTAKNRAKSGTP